MRWSLIALLVFFALCTVSVVEVEDETRGQRHWLNLYELIRDEIDTDSSGGWHLNAARGLNRPKDGNFAVVYSDDHSLAAG
jgi:hypothetical protein